MTHSVINEDDIKNFLNKYVIPKKTKNIDQEINKKLKYLSPKNAESQISSHIITLTGDIQTHLSLIAPDYWKNISQNTEDTADLDNLVNYIFKYYNFFNISPQQANLNLIYEKDEYNIFAILYSFHNFQNNKSIKNTKQVNLSKFEKLKEFITKLNKLEKEPINEYSQLLKKKYSCNPPNDENKCDENIQKLYIYAIGIFIGYLFHLNDEKLKDEAKAEEERLAAEKAAAEKKAEEERIAAEKKAEEEKAAVEKKVGEDKTEDESIRIVDAEKAEDKQDVAEEKAKTKDNENMVLDRPAINQITNINKRNNSKILEDDKDISGEMSYVVEKIPRQIIQSIYLYIIILIVFIYFLYSNFKNLLEFRWHIDTFNIVNKMCLQSPVSGIEIESTRYNINNFITKEYKNIKGKYHSSTKILEMFFICITFIFLGISFFEEKTYGITLTIIFLAIWFFMMSLHIKKQFKLVDQNIQDPDSEINKYGNTFTILNTIMIISDLKDVVFDYNYNKITTNERTLDEIIENNIASYYNISDTSKIKQIKLKSYEDLDFLKYITLNKMSSQYLKYFEEVYIRLTDSARTDFEEDEKFYIKDLVEKNVDYGKIKTNFESLSIILGDMLVENPNKKIQEIKQHIDSNYPIILKDYTQKQIHIMIIDFYYNSEAFFKTKKATNYEYGRKSSSQYIDSSNFLKKSQDLSKFNEIVQLLNEIEYNLDNIIYINEYTKINEEIGKQIGKNIIVTNNDYIQYLTDNYHVLGEEISDKQMKQTTENFKKVNNTIYIYIIYLVIISLLILHYLFITIDGPLQYIGLIFIFLVILVIFISLKRIFKKGFRNS